MFNKKAIGTLQVVTLIFASTAVAQQKAPAKQAAKQPIFDISSAPACASDSDVRSRIEWRQLSAAQQKEYTTAVQCLRKSGTGKNGEPTMSADFAKTHEVAAANNWAHGSPVFLPWHRIFVGLYEQALRSTCSYQAPLPYWDWSFDAGNLEKSQVISDFGGNGDRAKGFCVTSGPFADSNESSCIKRDLQGNFENQAEGAAKVRGEGGVSWSWIEMQNDIATSTNMAAVGRTLEFGAHAAIHNFVGGENGDMTRLARSARDALFYMHHTNVDRWYSEWQDANPTLAGQYNGKDLAGKAVSSTDTMFFNNMGSDVPVSKGLRTGKGTNGLTCYKYAPPLAKTAGQAPVKKAENFSAQKNNDAFAATKTEAAPAKENNDAPAKKTEAASTGKTGKVALQSPPPNLARRQIKRRQDTTNSTSPGALLTHRPVRESVLAKNNCTGACLTHQQNLRTEQNQFITYCNQAGWDPLFTRFEGSNGPAGPGKDKAGNFVSFTADEYKKRQEAALNLITKSPIYDQRIEAANQVPLVASMDMYGTAGSV